MANIRDESDTYLTEEEKETLPYMKEQEYYESKQKENLGKIKDNLRKKTYEELVDQIAKEQEVKALLSQAQGNMGLILSQSYGKIEEVKVLDDKKLIANIAGEKKEIAILHEPQTVYMNMRNFWGIYSFMDKIRYIMLRIYLSLPIFGLPTYGFLKFNLYVMRTDGEYTLDPSKDWTPWELQRKLEEFLRTSAIAVKAKIIANFLSDMRDTDQMNKLVLYFLVAFVLVIFMFLWVMNGGKA